MSNLPDKYEQIIRQYGGWGKNFTPGISNPIATPDGLQIKRFTSYINLKLGVIPQPLKNFTIEATGTNAGRVKYIGEEPIQVFGRVDLIGYVDWVTTARRTSLAVFCRKNGIFSGDNLTGGSGNTAGNASTLLNNNIIPLAQTPPNDESFESSADACSFGFIEPMNKNDYFDIVYLARPNTPPYNQVYLRNMSISIFVLDKG